MTAVAQIPRELAPFLEELVDVLPDEWMSKQQAALWLSKRVRMRIEEVRE